MVIFYYLVGGMIQKPFKNGHALKSVQPTCLEGVVIDTKSYLKYIKCIALCLVSLHDEDK